MGTTARIVGKSRACPAPTWQPPPTDWPNGQVIPRTQQLVLSALLTALTTAAVTGTAAAQVTQSPTETSTCHPSAVGCDQPIRSPWPSFGSGTPTTIATLTPTPTRTDNKIRGTVTDANGNPIDLVTVRLLIRECGTSITETLALDSTLTDGFGLYDFDKVADGCYTIEVPTLKDSLGLTLREEIDITGGDTEQVNLIASGSTTTSPTNSITTITTPTTYTPTSYTSSYQPTYSTSTSTSSSAIAYTGTGNGPLALLGVTLLAIGTLTALLTTRPKTGQHLPTMPTTHRQ